MKKLMAVLLAAVLLLGAAAFAEAGDITGEWYGSFFGMTMTLTLAEDGTYTMNVAGMDDEDETGTWTLDGGSLILNQGEETETAMEYDGETIAVREVNEAGEVEMEIIFSREPVEVFTPAEPKADAALEDYAGTWSATYASLMGMTVDAETMGMDMNVVIEGTTVSIEGEEEAIECEFKDGILYYEETVETGDEEGAEPMTMTYSVTALEDGTLCMEMNMGMEIAVYLAAAE